VGVKPEIKEDTELYMGVKEHDELIYYSDEKRSEGEGDEGDYGDEDEDFEEQFGEDEDW
jgi:hypothetical protein